jgi:DNA replication protein DnaC
MINDEQYKALTSVMRCRAFADKLVEMGADETSAKMSTEEIISVCIDAEIEARTNRLIDKRNREARFTHPGACIERIEYMPSRSLRRDSVSRLASCQFIEDKRNIIVLSPAGGGKSYFIQALGNAACRQGKKVRYVRHSNMCRDINIARTEDATYECMERYTDVELLIIDDLFLADTSMRNITDLLEIFESRNGRSSMILASQLPPEEWHLRIETKIIADSILDRIAHNSYVIQIEGPNMREHFAKKEKRP